ncbi:MAG TPA: hypothetical protein VF544_03895 [Pyrinomonadaceae bacterium]|jgi:hypothetical protein
MAPQDIGNIVAALISSVLGGAIVAFVNHYLSRSKTKAEIENMNAVTEKLKAETHVILYDVESLKRSATVANWNGIPIYDSSKRFSPLDFKGEPRQIWNASENRYYGLKGIGELKFELGEKVLNIERQNVEGTFEVALVYYLYNGLEQAFIPRNPALEERKLRIGYKAKVIGGEHYLRFVIKNIETGEWLKDYMSPVTLEFWRSYDISFFVAPSIDIQIVIFDERLSKSPSSVQIKDLLVAENKL